MLNYVQFIFPDTGLHTYRMKHRLEIRATEYGKGLCHCTRKETECIYERPIIHKRHVINRSTVNRLDVIPNTSVQIAALSRMTVCSHVQNYKSHVTSAGVYQIT
jgi:hypothetical protein